MSYQEFDPALAPGDEHYIPPGRHITASDGTVEGDCPSVSTHLSYACTLDAGHEGNHIAHGTEVIGGKRVDMMYAEWDDKDSTEL